MGDQMKIAPWDKRMTIMRVGKSKAKLVTVGSSVVHISSAKRCSITYPEFPKAMSLIMSASR